MNKCYEVYFTDFKFSVRALKIVIWICKLAQYFGSTAWYLSTKQRPFRRSLNHASKLTALWNMPVEFLIDQTAQYNRRTMFVPPSAARHLGPGRQAVTAWSFSPSLCISPARCRRRYLLHPCVTSWGRRHSTQNILTALEQSVGWALQACFMAAWCGLCFLNTDSQVANGTKVLIRSIEFVLIHLVSCSTDENLLGSNQRMKNSHSCTLISVKPHLS